MATSIKAEICAYSSFKVHPGHGKRYVRLDNKSFILLNSKCEAQFLSKKNPRKIAWTQFYRRVHKKGKAEEVQKKRTRRQQKLTRAIVGASISEIQKKKNEKPEQRQAAREAALREVKERRKAQRAAKASAAAAAAAKAPKQAAAKQATTKQTAPKNVKAAKPKGGKGGR